MKSYIKFSIVILMFISIISCASNPKNIEVQQDPEEIVTASGFILPTEISYWRLSQIYDFNGDGTDVGYNYINHLDDNLVGTIYIYPGKSTVTEDELKDELISTLATALADQSDYHVLLTDIGTKTENGVDYPMSFALFDYTINDIALSSFLVIVHVDNWIIKYRISCNQGDTQELDIEISSLLTCIQFPQ